MRCFYCGKRVSLVRKRIDADFCCDEHREQYNARTRRSFVSLAETEEQLAVTRRLNEGLPLGAAVAYPGPDLDELVLRNPGKALYHTWLPAGLPVSRARLETRVPPGNVCCFEVTHRNGTPPPPRPEGPFWRVDGFAASPRPPKPVAATVLFPQAGLLPSPLEATAFTGMRTPRDGTVVELGALARAVAVPRLVVRPAARSMGSLLPAAQPPEPIQPPPASPPIVVTLRHPQMNVHLGAPRASSISLRVPRLELFGVNHGPAGTPARPVVSSYLLIARRTLEMPRVWIAAGSIKPPRDPKGGHRLMPCPEGFRRKQYYAWELLDRFCALGFATIAGHRPEMRIAATPSRVPQLEVARLWAMPRNDRITAEPEPRRPPPPFQERLTLPAVRGITSRTGLRLGADSPLSTRPLDAIERLPQGLAWTTFPGVPPQVQQAGGGISRAEWVSGTAAAAAMPQWMRPLAASARRATCTVAIATRPPVFAGPEFLSGCRQAGPSPEFALDPPLINPRPTLAPSERAIPAGRILLPVVRERAGRLRQTDLLDGVCGVPAGRIAARPSTLPGYAIPLAIHLHGQHLVAAAARGLMAYAPARQSAAPSDIARGIPQRVEREILERFRRRGYEALRSRPTTPRWPAVSTPGAMPSAVYRPFPHPLRAPGLESAEAICRDGGMPAADTFRRACTLMDWGTLAPALHGARDWGAESHSAVVPMILPLVLPIDPHGPIRDWGLAPPPEPEQPPEPVHEDFASGLANWICTSPDWRQDIAGVRTGSLALLRPSLAMSDYDFEFLCRIENQSIGWVFRAANTSNYHAAQIALDSAGAARLVRFSVFGGDREPSSSDPLPVTVNRTASCRLRMSVHGSDFQIFLNDKPAAAWSDSRLSDGGVGFFSEADDRARLYWVKVTPASGAFAEDYGLPAAPVGIGIQHELRMGV